MCPTGHSTGSFTVAVCTHLFVPLLKVHTFYFIELEIDRQ